MKGNKLIGVIITVLIIVVCSLISVAISKFDLRRVNSGYIEATGLCSKCGMLCSDYVTDASALPCGTIEIESDLIK